MASEVTQYLLNAQSLDAQARVAAESALKQFEEQNAPAFLVSMSVELASNDRPDVSRRLAGLILKNAIDSKDFVAKAQLHQRWQGLDPAAKAQIKAALLASLSAQSQDARRSAAQVIAKIAAIEVPLKQWPELIGILLANMGSPTQPQPDHLKESSLDTIGYVCEEIAGLDALGQDQVNNVLTAVVQGMNQSEPNNDVRLAATRALYNALEFAHTNFENEMERNFIMTVVCEATLCSDVRVRKSAFENLVAVSSLYYDKLAPYMQDIFVITSKAAREDEESVALQAIELWSSICDEEIMMQEDYSGDSETNNNYQFIKQALPALVPMLLETLTKQEEGQDSDEDAWNLAMAGGTCLGLVARTVGDSIVPLVMPYVQENITKPDWRNREAATYAFGSILEGPSFNQLAPLVNMALSFMLNAMKDENSHVKDTTAWTLGRIFEFLHGDGLEHPVITAVNLPHILTVLLESIKDSPNVAEKICGCLYWLAQGYGSVKGQSPLSPAFQSIIQALLITADRDDAPDSRLKASAYEALNEVVRCSTIDTAPIILHLLPAVLQKLAGTMEMQILAMEDKERQSEIQALLCGVLQIIIQKLGASEDTKIGITQYADQIMTLFLSVFSCRNATVLEEAMLATGALAYCVDKDFAKYMPEFYRHLELGLQNFEEFTVCSITVGVVGDICRAIEDRMVPYCDGIMTQLLKNLSSSQLHRSVKPAIFSCFGDIALAIGENFEKYLTYAMPMLQSASEVTAQTQQIARDEELIDYNNQLRCGILEAYSGIFQGFKGNKGELMIPYAEHIILFIQHISEDKERDDGVVKAAVGVLGDLADTLGTTASPIFKHVSFHKDFLDECTESDDATLAETAHWALEKINSTLVAGN